MLVVRTNMKKIFKLTNPKIKVTRLVDSIRCDLRKYLKRERQRELPKGVDFWDFDCKIGPTAEEAKVIHVADIGKFISAAQEQQLESFYVEILAKSGYRTKKPNLSVTVRLKNKGEKDMGDKGQKDKGKREQQKKAKHSPKEKRQLKREKNK